MSDAPYDMPPIVPPHPTDMPPLGDPLPLPENDPREPLPGLPPLDEPPPPHEPNDPYPSDIPTIGDPIFPSSTPTGDPPSSEPGIRM